MSYTNSWITGIYLREYDTDQPDGTLMGFDADFGEMYALNGKLVPLKELKEAGVEPGELVRKPGELRVGDKVWFIDKTGERLEGIINDFQDDILPGAISVKCFKPSWKMEVNCLTLRSSVKMIKA